MNKTKIAIYLSLIFVAGVIAGGAVGLRSAGKFEEPRRHGPGHHNPEEFCNHIFNKMQERLKLTPEQIEKIKPIFWSGFNEVRAIQDRSVREVGEVIQRNHDQIARELTPEQKVEMEKMDREREEFMRKRGDAPPGFGPKHGEKPPEKGKE